jgi:HNH endonuclease
MQVCIFCQKPIGDEKTKEHILLNAFGGKATTSQIICAPCNNQFGGTIDRELAEQFLYVRNLFEMVSGTGATAPSMRNLETENGRINISGSGETTLADKIFTVEEIEEGKFSIQLKGYNLDQIADLIPHMAARIGLTEARLREQIATSTFTETQMPAGTIFLSRSYGGEAVLRAATKACMVLWAKHVGNQELLQSSFNAARNFVSNGDANFLKERTFLDTRMIPEQARIQNAYGPLFNLIHVSSDPAGKVTGHFTAYNLIGFQVVLAEISNKPDTVATLVNNPLDPRIWATNGPETFESVRDWKETPQFDTEQYKNRHSEMMMHYRRIADERAVQRLINRVFSENGIEEGQAIPRELFEKITAELGTVLAHHAIGVPLTRPVAQDIIARRFRLPPLD